MTTSCDCKIITIQWEPCALHAAAPALLEAVRMGYEFMEWWLRTSPVEQVEILHGAKGTTDIEQVKKQRDLLRAAIAAASRRT